MPLCRSFKSMLEFWLHNTSQGEVGFCLCMYTYVFLFFSLIKDDALTQIVLVFHTPCLYSYNSIPNMAALNHQ